MTLIVTRITVAEAATIINAFITFVSFTIALFLVVLLVKFLPTTTTAVAWSSISRTLHSSLWPTVLRTDSRTGQTEGVVVSILSRLGTLTTILVAVAGVILPLGLSEGPIVDGSFRPLKGTYIPDNSPLALSTTPYQDSFVYGRQCGYLLPVSCPGNDDPDSTSIAPSILEIFNSTPHGPFSMNFRRFYPGDEKKNCSDGFEASAETFVLRNDIFFADGLIVDMTAEQPGIGLWNQTVPTEVEIGGTWSQDILWIEPETECVDTNLTVDYFLFDTLQPGFDEFNITDHGGFYNLTREPPSFDYDGQNINLRQHAYKGAVYSNEFAMLFLNATRNSSSEGTTYPLRDDLDMPGLSRSDLQKISVLPLSYLNDTESIDISCRGFENADTANITNVHVHCGSFLGPPVRTDGGDSRMFDRGSKWAQAIHACSSTTRVSVQTVTFSSNSSTDMQGLQINRDKSGLNVLWATEKADLNIRDVDLFWGRVDDRYENHSSLWTTRSNRLYLPAGLSSSFPALAAGMPAAAHTQAWGRVYDAGFGNDELQDYSGQSDYAIRAKLQNLVGLDPIRGNSQIRNLVFTDIMANNIIGTRTNDTLMVAEHLKTLSYDFKYAIPGFLLLAIWIPSFLLSTLFFFTRSVTFTHMKQVFNHISVGRVVVGTSALRVQPQGGGTPYMPVLHNNHSNVDMRDSSSGGGLSGHRRNKSEWAGTVGKTPVILDFNNSPSSTRNVMEEDIKLMGIYSPHV
ncbi:hypothetical protein AGABI1DRAFT_108582 [Agaricus bisporus var. burnettii JB137-S8]|uniref:Uncharacterized protein n=1 Tax=Agaricus bisporus var. burnettii (strain JB137-S8 / ATCC MYA-4627 / FGSC 10392) TaxID=597362 RepID=K5XPR9_AGABU|nr:uncharacterized protein AGABI1DRAFT_108582 [Agaricus bisporus var. burnettii JB137-S8]EKM76725.1 hypothetical protein AGABI1DRAFT_108582 [Agaricus bisporus var. burnettii JB137-S8]